MQVQENNAAQGQNDAANNGGGRGRNIDTMDTDALRRYAKELRRDKGRMGGLIRRLELQGGIRQIQPTPVERRVPCHEPSVYDVKEFLKAFDSHLREKDATMLERATKMQRVTETPMITDMAEDGDELDEALKAIDTTAKEMKERAGEVECVICLQALAPGLVFKPAWCTHVTCISCIETYKTHKGVLVPCPMHCEGNSCSPEYWTKHSKALGEIQAEALVASASTNQNNDESARVGSRFSGLQTAGMRLPPMALRRTSASQALTRRSTSTGPRTR
jgi:hypothetical protein